MTIFHTFNYSSLLFFNFTHTLLSNKYQPWRNFFLHPSNFLSHSVCNLPQTEWNFSFTHFTLLTLLDPSLPPCSFSVLLHSTFHLTTFSSVLCRSLTFTPNRVLIFSSILFASLKKKFSLVMSLVWSPTTQVWWASEVQKNKNNRMHPAKGALSEFHYSSLNCRACVCVCVCSCCLKFHVRKA